MNRTGAPASLMAWAAAVAVVLTAGWAHPGRAGPALLLAGVYLAGLGVGGLFIHALLVVTGAAWHRPFESLPLQLARCLPVATILLFGVTAGFPETYPWTSRPEPGLRGLWLSETVFTIRTAACLGSWMLFARWLVRAPGSVPVAAACLAVLAPTAWLAANDWLMSLSPGWASTVFGPYVFLGWAGSALAALAVAASLRPGAGSRAPAVPPAAVNDLACLLLAFTTLWAYAWYCQYMLVWYTNLPHEAGYFATRTDGSWRWPFFGAVVLGWAVPFALLLSAAARRRRVVVLAAAASVLAGRWLDLYALIGPASTGAAPGPGWLDLGGAAAVMAWATWALGRRDRLPPGAERVLDAMRATTNGGE